MRVAVLGAGVIGVSTAWHLARAGADVVVLGGSVVVVRVGGARVAVDACVVALGSHTPALLAPLGIGVPVYPVKGHGRRWPKESACVRRTGMTATSSPRST